MQRCLQDVLEEAGDLNEVDMKEQITIRMTKTMRQDDPPHYSTQDSKLIRHITEGLIEWVSDDLRNEWYQQANRYIVIGDQITSQCLEQCDCAVEITMCFRTTSLSKLCSLATLVNSSSLAFWPDVCSNC